jgi:hypothetical protein
MIGQTKTPLNDFKDAITLQKSNDSTNVYTLAAFLNLVAMGLPRSPLSLAITCYFT